MHPMKKLKNKKHTQKYDYSIKFITLLQISFPWRKVQICKHQHIQYKNHRDELATHTQADASTALPQRIWRKLDPEGRKPITGTANHSRVFVTAAEMGVDCAIMTCPLMEHSLKFLTTM